MLNYIQAINTEEVKLTNVTVCINHYKLYVSNVSYCKWLTSQYIHHLYICIHVICEIYQCTLYISVNIYITDSLYSEYILHHVNINRYIYSLACIKDALQNSPVL